MFEKTKERAAKVGKVIKWTAIGSVCALAVAAGMSSREGEAEEPQKAQQPGASAQPNPRTPGRGIVAIRNASEIRSEPGYGEGTFCGTADGKQEVTAIGQEVIDERRWIRIAGAAGGISIQESSEVAACQNTAWGIATD